jgi:flagellar basal-body rod modification protein FlgD
MATSVTGTTSGFDYSALNPSTATSGSTADEIGDRFLKMLIAQVQNQDPLSPMDNAQVTSQMAQINTVSGLEKLNTTVGSLSSQFMQLQMLQGATLVGHDVVVPGNALKVEGNTGEGAFELTGAADGVQVEVLGPSGQVLKTLDLGARSSGTHTFNVDASGMATAGEMTFRIKATSGANTVPSTTLAYDRVAAVSAQNGQLTLELERSGQVTYDKVRSIN